VSVDLIKDNLKSILGSFWTEHFRDKSLIDGWCQGLALQSRQLDRNLDEIRGLTSIQKTPVDHVELWRSLRLVQNRTTGSYYPLRYDELGAVYGEDGTPPIHDKIFRYGDDTDHRGLALKADITPKSVLFITDSINNPSFVLVDGIDFIIKNGVFVFVNDINDNESARATVETSLYNDQDVYGLWGYYCTFDLEYMARQWGYLISFENASSGQYNSALWALWKARRFGLTPDVFKEIVSIYLRCPRSITSNEVVETILYNPDLTTTVITTANVYTLTSTDTPAVEVGDVLSIGDFVGNKVSVLEPGNSSFIRPKLDNLEEYEYNGLLGSDGLIETNYIHFNTDITAATIRKDVGLDYTPSYSVISSSSGTHNVRTRAIHRYSKNDFILEIDTEMLPGPQTQVGFLQVYSVTGIPLFSEPYTGNIDPVSGVSNFITDKDDVLKLSEDAFTEKVNEVDRVVLISMFDDRESLEIKQVLQGLRFLDNRAISVTVYPSVSVYTDLPVEGASFSTVEREHLLNYDMVFLNTGSGYMSVLDASGNLQEGPSITDNEFIDTVVSNLDQSISELKTEVAVIDNDLVWLINYVKHDIRPSDKSWLYQLSGTRGIPLLDSVDGKVFYNYGGFSVLDEAKVSQHEINNQKTTSIFKIPEVPWASSTGSGVESNEVNIPVYSKLIEISGTSQRLETTLPSGFNYIYKVSSLVSK